MINVDSHGNVSSFSPELLGLQERRLRRLPARQHQHPVAGGNPRDLPAVGASTATSRPASQACSASCEYFSVCGGGAPVNKLFENGTFTGTETSYCTLTQMVPTDLILEAYDRLEQSWAGNDQPADGPSISALLTFAPDGPGDERAAHASQQAISATTMPSRVS